MKEYLSRGTYIFRPEASQRLTVDLIVYTVKHVPKWNPINVCPYHLQEAGATPVQELAYGARDRDRRARRGARLGPGRADDEFPEVVGRISFFIDAGVRFVEEMCKMRAVHARCGTASAPSATASPTRSCAASATACR